MPIDDDYEKIKNEIIFERVAETIKKDPKHWSDRLEDIGFFWVDDNYGDQEEQEEKTGASVAEHSGPTGSKPSESSPTSSSSGQSTQEGTAGKGTTAQGSNTSESQSPNGAGPGQEVQGTGPATPGPTGSKPSEYSPTSSTSETMAFGRSSGPHPTGVVSIGPLERALAKRLLKGSR